MRWRFLAASVCATEIRFHEADDRDQNRRQIRGRADQDRVEKPGSVSGGRLWGTAPTILPPRLDPSQAGHTPRRSSPPRQGPVRPLSAMSAMPPTGVPRRSKRGFRPVRTQNRNRGRATPIARVIQLINLPGWRTRSTPAPPAMCGPMRGTPRMCFSWLVAIRMPEAVMNPAITGWLRKVGNEAQPKDTHQHQKSTDRQARVSAATHSPPPSSATCPIADRCHERDHGHRPDGQRPTCSEDRHRGQSARWRRRALPRRQTGQQGIGQRLRDQHDRHDHRRDHDRLPSALPGCKCGPNRGSEDSGEDFRCMGRVFQKKGWAERTRSTHRSSRMGRVRNKGWGLLFGRAG